MIRKLLKGIIDRTGYGVYRKNQQQQLVNTDDYYLVPKKTGPYPVTTDDHYILPKTFIRYAADLLYTAHNCDFLHDPRFAEAYRLGKATDVNETVLKNYDIQWRIHTLCWAASQAKHLEGDFVDCGVNTGIFARAAAHYINFEETGKTWFLLDTFTGMDERYSTDKEYKSDLNERYMTHKDTLYDQVKQTFRDYNVKIIKGPVPDTLPQVTSGKIAYLSVDMNCAAPEVSALHYFWDKMVPGGIIILDDYGYNSQYPEQKQGHDDFARSKGVEVLSLPTCQGMIIKPH